MTGLPIDYRQATTFPPPGPIASRWIEPLPKWVWRSISALLVVAAALYPGSWFDPVCYYLAPAVWIVFGILFALVYGGAIVIRSTTRRFVAKRHGIRAEQLQSERRDAAKPVFTAALICGIACFAVPIRIAVALRSSALNAVRDQVRQHQGPTGPFTVFPFRFSGAELYDDRYVVLYTDGIPGSFAGSGSGLLYAPDGERMPPYNDGSEGYAFGNWYWFTTD